MRGAALLLVALLALPLAAVAGGDHPHTFQRGTCTDWSEPVKGCQHRMCPYRCSYPGCSAFYTLPETRGCEGGGGKFGGGGASGEYSAAPPAAVPLWEGKGGKFGGGGATGGYEPHEHDLGPVRCGPWSNLREGCKIRHCNQQCKICRGDFNDDFEADPPGCF